MKSYDRINAKKWRAYFAPLSALERMKIFDDKTFIISRRNCCYAKWHKQTGSHTHTNTQSKRTNTLITWYGNTITMDMDIPTITEREKKARDGFYFWQLFQFALLINIALFIIEIAHQEEKKKKEEASHFRGSQFSRSNWFNIHAQFITSWDIKCACTHSSTLRITRAHLLI